jgi:general secretion pathway protein N
MGMRFSSQSLVGATLAALCLGLGAVAVREFTAPPEMQEQPVTTAAQKSTTSTPAAFTLPPLQRFAVITERPLFSPDRKPQQHADDSAGAWSSFVLAGIIITPQSREALVLHGKPQTVAHVQEGQAVEGWTMTSIYPDHVVFRDGANEHELKLIAKAPPPTVTTRPRLPLE